MRAPCRQLATALLATLLVASFSSATNAQGTAITYQGLVQTDGFPAAGPVDLRFRLYDNDVNGTQLGPEITVLAVDLVAGTFSVPLDFGVEPYLALSRRYLEIDARRVGGESYTTLAPRQFLSAAPYSINTRGIFVDIQGNVGIQTSTPAFPLDVRGGFRASGGLVNDASNLIATEARGTNPGWQSFVAEHNGELRSVTFRTIAPAPWTGTLQIFSGQGTGGAALTSPIAIGGPGSPTAQSVTAAIPAGTALAVGNTYTFALTSPNNFTPMTSNANPYPPGQANSGANTDLYFITQISPTGLLVNADGRVGIGTEAPTAELDVRGNVRLGSNGQFSAVAAEEQLRFIRGRVGSSPASGTGWTASQVAPGTYFVFFTTPFPAGTTPTVVVTPTSTAIVDLNSVTHQQFQVSFELPNGQPALTGFHFIVTGPR
ncbi:MAG: hypothetical protein ACOYN0_12465 [Phycisphaerales bacterium]